MIRFFAIILLLAGPALMASNSQLINVTTPITVVIVNEGNVSFVCDFNSNTATSWILNGENLDRNGTLNITTDELFRDAAACSLQCVFSDLTNYSIAVVLVTSPLVPVKWINGPSCAFSSITPSTTSDIQRPILTSTTPLAAHTPTTITLQSPCTGTLCIVHTSLYIATAAVGGSALLVVVCMVVISACYCCCCASSTTQRRTRRPSTSGVVVNPLAWERPIELTPLDLSQASFNFNTSPK